MVVSSFGANVNVKITLADALTGSIVREDVGHNVGTLAYCSLLAAAAANAAGSNSTVLSHVSLGASGQTLSTLDSTSGWTGTPTADTSSYREGTASLYKAVTAEGTATIDNATIALDLDGQDSIEVPVKVTARANLDSDTEAIRLASSSNGYFYATWDDLETALNASLVDGTWSRAVIPKGSFTTEGSASWSAIRQLALTVTANDSGALTASWDRVLAVPDPATVTTDTVAVENEQSKVAYTSIEDLGAGQVRVKAFWNSTQAVGPHRIFGLYANSGWTLAGVYVPDDPIEKTALLTLTVEWTVTFSGTGA